MSDIASNGGGGEGELYCQLEWEVKIIRGEDYPVLTSIHCCLENGLSKQLRLNIHNGITSNI